MKKNLSNLVIGAFFSLALLCGNPSRAMELDKFQKALAKIAEDAFPGIVSIKTTKRTRLRTTPAVFEEFFDFHFEGLPEGVNIELLGGASINNYGSGFIASEDGLILTSGNVIDKGSKITVRLHDGSICDAIPLGIDKETNVALLKIKAPRKLHSLKLADSSEIRPGFLAVTVAPRCVTDYTMTFGIISRKGQLAHTGRQCILSDLITDSLNIGGPLLNINGEVIGLNDTLKADSIGSLFANASLSYSIPSNTVKSALKRLLKCADKIKQQPMTQKALRHAENLKVFSSYGIKLALRNDKVYISDVAPGSPAAWANLKEGMKLEAVNRQPVSTPKQAELAASKYPNRLALYIDAPNAKYFIVLSR